MAATLKAVCNAAKASRRRDLQIATIAGVSIAAVMAAQGVNQGGRWVLMNASPSEPEGLYLRTSNGPAIGRLVTFMAPAPASSYVDRHLTYLRTTPVLKALAAGPGSLVCTRHGQLVIDGQVKAPVMAMDPRGVQLPRWNDCRRLGAGEWFAYSNRVPNSFDSRYYGPIRTDQVIAVYRPLLVADAPAR